MASYSKSSADYTLYIHYKFIDNIMCVNHLIEQQLFFKHT